MKREEPTKAIVHELTLDTTPSHAYRALTSQTELRKWWAPRVITARGVVSYEEGKDIEMRLLQNEKNHMVRYSWRPKAWEEDVPESVITFEITDHGLSRDSAGEGIGVIVTHDGWVDQEARDRQAKLLGRAMASLKSLLEKNKVDAWWETALGDDGYRQINQQVLRQFAERIEKENRGKPDKKLASQNIWKLCQGLEGQGVWLMKENGNEFELRFKDSKLFSVIKSGQISLAWREMETLVGKRGLKELSNRLALEQDVDVRIGKAQDKVGAQTLHVDLFVEWVIDVIQHSAREE